MDDDEMEEVEVDVWMRSSVAMMMMIQVLQILTLKNLITRYVTLPFVSAFFFLFVYISYNSFVFHGGLQNNKIADTTAEQVRTGKDIQGIPQVMLSISREKYRQTRLQQYKNTMNMSLSSEKVMIPAFVSQSLDQHSLYLTHLCQQSCLLQFA